MKLLVVFLVAGLACSCLAQWTVPSCTMTGVISLITGIMKVTVNNTELSGNNLVAQLLCHVQMSSGFYTGALNNLTIERKDHDSGDHEHHSQSGCSRPRSRRHDKRPFQTRPKPTTRPPPIPKTEMWSFYGIFQLPNRVVCDDGVTPSLNLCELPCHRLIDSELYDDSQCLKTILSYIETGSIPPQTEEFKIMIAQLFKEQCNPPLKLDYCPGA